MYKIILFTLLGLYLHFASPAMAQYSSDGYYKKAASADPRSVKDPRSANPASAYPSVAQQSTTEKKTAAENLEEDNVAICDVTLSDACNRVFKRASAGCDAIGMKCETQLTDGEDASCTAQACELQKAMCAVEAATQFQSCLQSIAPVK